MAKELSRDEQRAKDRQDELDRQATVQKALDDHYAESRKEAQRRLDEGKDYIDHAELDRLDSVHDALSASVKAHDKNAAEAAKAKRS